MMQQVFNSLPDDKPITGICVIEDVSKIPNGFSIVSRTHDQDSDADLWKGSTFFGGKISRYLCLSKTEGIGEFIVESLSVIGEKEQPPDGYCIISKTIDTDAKAWKKRQICYRLTRRNVAISAVSDVILLSKGNRAPDGFELVGSVNGLAVCIKNKNLRQGSQNASPAPVLGYSLNPNGVLWPGITSQKPNGVYPTVANQDAVKDIPTSPSDEYVNLLLPQRPAPLPPQISEPGVVLQHPPPRPPPPVKLLQPTVSNNYGTLSTHHGLEGVPFVLHPSLQPLRGEQPMLQITVVKTKTKEEIDKEYYYDFRLERQST